MIFFRRRRRPLLFVSSCVSFLMNGHRETEKKLKTLVRVWFPLFKRFKAKGD